MLNNIKYNFCISNILEIKKKFQHKICYKKKYSFLNLKDNPTKSISTRLTKKGNFLKIYKFIKKFYLSHMLKTKYKSIPLSSSFLFFFNKYKSFRDFDRVLFWKYIQLDCMFSVKVKKIKKKKIN